jgi:predicted amidohydrolase
MKTNHKLVFYLLLIPLFIQSGKSDLQLTGNHHDGVFPAMSDGNLVKNPGFEIIDPSNGLPLGWKITSPREEIAPEYKADQSVSHSGKYSAMSVSRGSKGTYGFWSTTVTGIQMDSEAKEFDMSVNTLTDTAFLSNKSFRIRCFFKTKGIESPGKNIWISATWLDKKGEKVFTELISSHRKEGDWYHTEKVLTAPWSAVSLDLELIFQWSSTGTVWWDDVTVENAPTPPARKIKLATSDSQPSPPSTPENNLKFYADKIVEAGKLKADIICLGEGITRVSTRQSIESAAESIPGPSTTILGEAARKSNIYVVAGIYEREGSYIYNTAILLDRKGNIAGKYRKTHLPETEAEGGITPGTSYPVFKTDFGTIGIQVCYDNFFPEVARTLTLNGAEVIFLPIWGDTREQYNTFGIVARARAIDNAVYMVSSMYYRPEGCLIINPDGHILKNADGKNGIITAEVNLNSRTFERWLSVSGYGEWKNLFPQERRSETYNELYEYHK